MFGRGNQAPGALLQQPPPGAPQPYQQGGHVGPVPGRPVMQHLRNQSELQVYQTALMLWHPQSGESNEGIYVHGSQYNIGSNQANYHYLPGQLQHPQHGMPNLYHVPSLRPNLPPPASHGFQISESLVPPPLPSLHSCASLVPPAFPPSGLPISDGKELTSVVFNAASESPVLMDVRT